MLKLRPDESGNLCIQKNEGQLRMIPTKITGDVDDYDQDRFFDGWAYLHYKDQDDWEYQAASRKPRVSLSLSQPS